MKTYRGSCHCGAIRFAFKGPEKIENGLRCNCSICRRKGALMSGFTIAPDEIEIEVTGETIVLRGDYHYEAPVQVVVEVLLGLVGLVSGLTRAHGLSPSRSL